MAISQEILLHQIGIEGSGVDVGVDALFADALAYIAVFNRLQIVGRAGDGQRFETHKAGGDVTDFQRAGQEPLY